MWASIILDFQSPSWLFTPFFLWTFWWIWAWKLNPIPIFLSISFFLPPIFLGKISSSIFIDYHPTTTSRVLRVQFIHRNRKTRPPATTNNNRSWIRQKLGFSISHLQWPPIPTERVLPSAALPLTDRGISLCLLISSYLWNSYNCMCWIAEMGLVPDPLLPPRRSNCVLIPWTWTMRSPVFIAKLEGWKMYVPPFLCGFSFCYSVVHFVVVISLFIFCWVCMQFSRDVVTCYIWLCVETDLR